jgi:heterodisulfide reductase subunit B
MMSNAAMQDISYYPGCTLKASMQDNNQSLISVMRHLGYNLVELVDWSCCGASAAHSIDLELTTQLAARNLAQAPVGRPLLVPCPSCLMRLLEAHEKIKTDPALRKEYEERWGKPFDEGLQIVHLFDLLDAKQMEARAEIIPQRLSGLKFVPYYGCLLTRPSRPVSENRFFNKMESLLELFGAEKLQWCHTAKCCGTFLSITRPDVVTPLVDEIVRAAALAGADVIVTTCELCQINLEVRCSLEEKVPVMPITQLLALALGAEDPRQFDRKLSHLVVDPRPVLHSKGLLAKSSPH